jgi:predicted DNA-binding transcriptional regulator AlpA
VTDEAGIPRSDVRAVAEAVVDVLAERGLVVYAGSGPGASRVLNVAEVARLLGRKPPWVYAHAAELGAIRFGDGPRARIGFDLATIERWKRAHQLGPQESRAPTRRRPRRLALPESANLIPYEPAAGLQA